jgi:hypothetical protein
MKQRRAAEETGVVVCGVHMQYAPRESGFALGVVSAGPIRRRELAIASELALLTRHAREDSLCFEIPQNGNM